MSHFTPTERTRKLEQILSRLKDRDQDTNWDLLDSFSRVVYAALPDWMAQNIAAPELADRLLDNYRFFVEQLPPPNQLYRGVPGLHVVARSSGENEVLHTVRGKEIPMDTTIVETHTPDAPFVFDGLKNYFRKAGLRIFSAIHPIITVRRQWERIVWIGDAQADGDKELLCRFRIEHIESKERLRHLQHELFCVLKCIFLALEDFQEMMRSVHSVSERLS